jgi:diacylglycerol kinase (ATP)
MWAVVINPIAGRGKGALLGTQVTGFLHSQNIDYSIITAPNTELLRDALERFTDSVDTDGVIAVGGDGLVHLVLQVVAKKFIPFAVIPAGTGNDFSKNLGISCHSVEEILSRVLSSKPKPIDLGLVDSEYFGAILSTGFDSIVNERANVLSWPKGPSRYNAAIVLELPKFKPLEYEISIDGNTFTTQAMLIAVGNGTSYGGGMKVCPDADIHDGLFDIMVLRPVSKLEFLRIFPSVYIGAHIEHEQVEVLKGKSVTISSDAIAYADGERVGQLPVKAECISNAALAWAL